MEKVHASRRWSSRWAFAIRRDASFRG